MITQWHIDRLEKRIVELERENVETTNALYEMENRLQSQLDALITYTMFEPNDVF
jgi:prefoldin subunit 5